jgi:hypothetical protein
LCVSLQQIDGKAFLLLTQTDIVKVMKIKLGPALKIYNSILMFRTSRDFTEDNTASGQEARDEPTPELELPLAPGPVLFQQ